MTVSTPFCGYMLASSVPLLQDQKLCDFLEEMDKKEEEVLAREEVGIKKELSALENEYSWTNILRECFFQHTIRGAAAGAIGYGFSQSLDNNREQTKAIFAAAMPLAVVIGGVSVCFNLKESCAIYHAKKDILETASILTDPHVLRLEAKVRKIGERLKNSQDELEQEQLPCAKDCFVQKLQNLRLSKTNTIKVVYYA